MFVILQNNWGFLLLIMAGHSGIQTKFSLVKKLLCYRLWGTRVAVKFIIYIYCKMLFVSNYITTYGNRTVLRAIPSNKM